jgi:hypothetical protein
MLVNNESEKEHEEQESPSTQQPTVAKFAVRPDAGEN